MATTETQTQTVRRIGKEERNLTNFPIAVLSKRPGDLVLEFRDGDKEWILTGDPKYGLPQAPYDVRVYLVLLELSREQGWPNTVQFSRYQLLRRLDEGTARKDYDRLLLALDRWVGVTIRTRNAFTAVLPGGERRLLEADAFHVLNRYKIVDVEDPDGLGGSRSCAEWGPDLYQNLRNGYFQSVDLELCMRLSGAALQLYRYLAGKRFDGKPRFQIGLRRLCCEHLGLGRGQYPSYLKKVLNPAHDELVREGVVARVEYAPMADGEEMAIYHFTAAAQRVQPAVLPAVASELVQRIQRCGVHPKVAENLVATYGAERCERQLRWLPKRKCEDRAKLLIASIRDDYTQPTSVAKEAAVRAVQKIEQGEQRRRAQEIDQVVLERGLWQNYVLELPAAEVLRIRQEADALLEADPILRKNRLPSGKFPEGLLESVMRQVVDWPSPPNPAPPPLQGKLI